MRDVMEKIISTEGEARLIVEAATAEGERILSEARERGREIIATARQEAVMEAEGILEAAQAEAEKEKERRLAQASIDIERTIQLEPKVRDKAIEGVVRCVCGLSEVAS